MILDFTSVPAIDATCHGGVVGMKAVGYSWR